MNAVTQYQVEEFRAHVAWLMAGGVPFGSAVAQARKEYYLPEVRFGYRPKTVAELERDRAHERRWAA